MMRRLVWLVGLCRFCIFCAAQGIPMADIARSVMLFGTLGSGESWKRLAAQVAPPLVRVYSPQDGSPCRTALPRSGADL
jgi:hypothetical protein